MTTVYSIDMPSGSLADTQILSIYPNNLVEIKSEAIDNGMRVTYAFSNVIAPDSWFFIIENRLLASKSRQVTITLLTYANVVVDDVLVSHERIKGSTTLTLPNIGLEGADVIDFLTMLYRGFSLTDSAGVPDPSIMNKLLLGAAKVYSDWG